MLSEHSFVKVVLLDSLRRSGEVRPAAAIGSSTTSSPEICNAATLILGNLQPILACGSTRSGLVTTFYGFITLSSTISLALPLTSSFGPF